MLQVILAHEVDLATWRQAARYYAAHRTPPEALTWSVLPQEQLCASDFTGVSQFDLTDIAPLNIPRRFVELLLLAFQATDPARFALLYRLVYRMVCEGVPFASMQDDPDILALTSLVALVKQETARFREAFAAHYRHGLQNEWHYEPELYCLEANARFCRALVTQPWAITTPYRCMKWDGQTLLFGAGAAHNAAWQADTQGIWNGYPNTVLLPTYKQTLTAGNLDQLSAEAVDCRACELWQPANRMVFGEGPANASLMLVGEQPGDQEDKGGHPFIGPAGQIFDRALHEAGLTRGAVYITNAVKHFKFVWRGTHRLHQKPGQENITACRAWLDAERRMVQPKLIVMMGATAAQSLLKRPITIARERSRLFEFEQGQMGLVTVHPSYLLRLQSESDKQREYARFVSDLTLAQTFVGTQAV